MVDNGIPSMGHGGTARRMGLNLFLLSLWLPAITHKDVSKWTGDSELF